jgi:hypothetical protein
MSNGIMAEKVLYFSSFARRSKEIFVVTKIGSIVLATSYFTTLFDS